MSDNNFLKIANVCSVPISGQIIQPNKSINNVSVPISVDKGSTVTTTDQNVVGMYVVPATPMPTTTTTTAFIQLPAKQIHQVVQQVVDRQAPQPVPVAGNVQTSYVIQSPVNLQLTQTSSAGIRPATKTVQHNYKVSHSAVTTAILNKLKPDNETLLQNNVLPASKSSSPPSVQANVGVPVPSPTTHVQKQNPEVATRLCSPSKPVTLPQGAIFKSTIKPTEKDVLLKKEIAAAQIVRLPKTVVRPASPTRMCVLQKSDESLFSSSLVQIKVKADAHKGQIEQTRDVVCGISCKARVKISKFSTLPLDSDLFWCNFCPFKCETKVEFLHHVMTHRFNCNYCKFQAFSRGAVIQHSVKSHSALFQADSFSFCSLFSDHLKFAVGESNCTQTSPQKSSPDFLREEMTESNNDLLDLVLEDDQITVKESTKRAAVSEPPIPPPVSKVAKPHPVSKVTKEVPTKDDKLIRDTAKSWNCRYCDFVSQNYKLINIHCTIMHPNRLMSAREVKITKELAVQIRKLDTIRQLHLDKGEKEFMKSTKQKPDAQLNRKSADVKELNSRDPCIQIFECCNCHGQTLKIKELANHLKTEHSGQLQVGLDLKAVRLRQARNVAFCPKKDCQFYSRHLDPYDDHVKFCCPDWSELDEDEMNSLHLTLQFAQRNMKTHSRTKTNLNTMSCVYCEYETKLPFYLKKHVTINHPNERTAYRLSKTSEKGTRKVRIFFCPQCMRFQTPRYIFLKQHMSKVHNIDTSKPAATGLLGARDILSNGSIEIDIATSNDDPDEESNYMDMLDDEDTKPDPEELSSLMEEFLEGEAQAKKAAGHSSRQAAIKADVRLKNATPRRYRCKQCSYQCLGLNLMRTHITNDHPGFRLEAVDVIKRANRQRAIVYLCPEVGCPYGHTATDRFIEHCKTEHGIKDVDLPSPGEESSVKGVTHPNYPPMFECLYCEASFVTNTPALMKDHLKQFHPGEVIIMRDLVARKLGAPCRLYMCDHSSCEHTTNNMSEYLIHVRQHRGYENAHKEDEQGEEVDYGNDQNVGNLNQDENSDTNNDDNVTNNADNATNNVDNVTYNVDNVTNDVDNVTNNCDNVEPEGTMQHETIDLADDDIVDEIMVQDTTTKDVMMIKLDI